jgi:hypothetical protein
LHKKTELEVALVTVDSAAVAIEMIGDIVALENIVVFENTVAIADIVVEVAELLAVLD